MYHYINFIIFYDLWRMIKNPFYPQRKRMQNYIIISVLLILIVVILTPFSSLNGGVMAQVEFWILFMLNSIFILGSLVCVGLVVSVLRHHESNRDLRIKVSFRYLFVCLFILPPSVFIMVMWLKFHSANMKEGFLFLEPHDVETLISIMTSFLQIVVAFVRINEPYILYLVNL